MVDVGEFIEELIDRVVDRLRKPEPVRGKVLFAVVRWEQNRVHLQSRDGGEEGMRAWELTHDEICDLQAQLTDYLTRWAPETVKKQAAKREAVKSGYDDTPRQMKITDLP